MIDNQRSRLELDPISEYNNQEEEEDNYDYCPLDEKVIQAVREAPNLRIRPASLASTVGISLDDACAELCGLLSAVGLFQ